MFTDSVTTPTVTITFKDGQGNTIRAFQEVAAPMSNIADSVTAPASLGDPASSLPQAMTPEAVQKILNAKMQEVLSKSPVADSANSLTQAQVEATVAKALGEFVAAGLTNSAMTPAGQPGITDSAYNQNAMPAWVAPAHLKGVYANQPITPAEAQTAGFEYLRKQRGFD